MNRSRTLVITIAGLVVGAASACGSDGGTPDAGGDARLVEVAMADNTFSLGAVTVTRGETVRFVFTNTGAVAHDAFIGDADAQDGHEMDMRNGEEGMDHGGMTHGDDANDAITVEPGATGELTHTFDNSGTLLIGCHQTGHYAGGMKLTIDVT